MQNKRFKKLLHYGIKNKYEYTNVSYLYSQNLIYAICNVLDGKHANEIKLLLVLLGNIGDGSFKVSRQFILNQTGLNKNSYYKARDYLQKLGWVIITDSSVIVNTDKVYKDGSVKRNRL